MGVEVIKKKGGGGDVAQMSSAVISIALTFYCSKILAAAVC